MFIIYCTSILSLTCLTLLNRSAVTIKLKAKYIFRAAAILSFTLYKKSPYQMLHNHQRPCTKRRFRAPQEMVLVFLPARKFSRPPC